MGACCSRSYHVEADESLDVSRHVVPGSRKINLGIPDGINIRKVDSEELEFFDAFQPFAKLNHYADDAKGYTYPPTSSMQIGVSALCIESAPGDLLLADHTNSAPIPSQVPPEKGQEKQCENKTSLNDPTLEIRKKLRETQGGVTDAPGYPGQLNEDELNACLKFREELKTRDSAYREMVHAYAPAETEAFALCRFLRAREFDVDAVFAMLEENNACDVWKEAKANNFYKDFEAIYGCPASVFMALYPVVVSGIAKNGATMFYFKPGNMDINGLESVCNVVDLLPMLWDLLHSKGTDSMLREAKSHDPTTTTVLAQRIIVMDLKGIPSALFDREFFRLCERVVNCFPETMNRTYMVNVPMTFQVVWAAAKLFMDERTLRKVGFFSKAYHATQDLLQFVDASELLSTYGGAGPSFEEVVQERQTEYGTKPESRYITKTLTVTSYETKVTVRLRENETVSSIRIYSKGDAGAEFWVISEDSVDGKTLVESTTIKRPHGSEKAHYSAELDVSTIPSGQNQKISILGKGCVARSKEFYLVVAHICSCC